MITIDELNGGGPNINVPVSEWYLATTKPRQELRAVENLYIQGIKAFSPTCKIEKIRAGKRVVVTEALFTGYVFIKLSQNEALWHKVLSTRGIRGWVRFANTMAKLPKTLVEDLIDHEEVEAKKKIETAFNSGTVVSIISGAFQGLKGVYQAPSGDERSMILINFLGKENLIKVGNTHIQTA